VKRSIQSLVLPFPLARRRDLVQRLVAQMVARPVERAERHLAAQLRRQRAALQRKGILDEQSNREIGALTAAVNREIWRFLLRGPSPNDGQRDVSR